jgi:4-amino-4-deoxy-L-arabinose transferase-like glycosyltransferase
LACFAFKDESMPALEPGPREISRGWTWSLFTVALILASAGLRLAYLARDCPLDLAPDEAHYWDWSRHLDWCYYSKGPLVAYLIRFSIMIAGSWSEQLTGNLMLAVRLPAVICGGLLLLSLYILTRQIYGRPGLAAGIVVAALTMPVVNAGATLMTIDAPFTCCWGWALVFGYQAMCRGSRWAWPLTGLLVGLGILAKYTMILWPVSAGLFLLTSPARRVMLLRPGFWIMLAVAGVCCLPILVWNLEHDWIGYRHLTRLAGFDGSAFGIRWLGPLSFVGQQALLHLGFWFIVWLIAMIVYRPWKSEWLVVSGEWLVLRGYERSRTTHHSPLTTHFLWWFSAPTFVMFLLFSFKTGGGEPNWPVVAYISGLVLAAGWLTTQFHSSVAWIRRWTWAGLASACGFALAVSILMHNTAWAGPFLARVSGSPTAKRPLPMRRFDPTCRLRGWRQLATEVDHMRSKLLAEGTDPLVIAGSWTLPGELGFYCQGRPTVYSLGPALADRHSQYDLWRPNPILDPERFQGRTMIFVGEITPPLRQAFAEVEPSSEVTFSDGGHPVARWTVTVCRDFHGLPGDSLSHLRPGF